VTAQVHSIWSIAWVPEPKRPMTLESSRARRAVTIALVAATRMGLRWKSWRTAKSSFVRVSKRKTSPAKGPGKPKRALPCFLVTSTVAELSRSANVWTPGTIPAISLNQ
jgi:hypothetical protein